MWWVIWCWLGLGVAAAQPSDAELTELEADALSAEALRDDAASDDRAAAAVRAVELRQALLDAAIARGEVTLRTEPPEATGSPPRVTPISLPAPVAALVTARGRLLGLVPHTAEGIAQRREHDLANALTVMRYGHFEWARERLWRIYVESCRSDGDAAESAWTQLYEMAVDEDQRAEAEALADDFAVRLCAAARPVAGHRPFYDCDSAVMVRAPWRVGQLHYSRATELEAAGLDASVEYERAARSLLNEVERFRARPPECFRPPELARATLLSAEAFERAGRQRSAVATFELAALVAEETRASADEDTDIFRARAMCGAARTSERLGEPEAAAAHLEAVLSDQRLLDSSMPETHALLTIAAVDLARLYDRQDDAEHAAEAWARAARLLEAPEAIRAARLHRAEALRAASDVEESHRAFRELLRSYEDDESALEARVVVAWRLTRSARRSAEARRYTEMVASLVAVLPTPGGDVPISEAQQIAARVELARADALLEETRPRRRAAAVAEAAALLARAAARSIEGTNGPACVRLLLLRGEVPDVPLPVQCDPPVPAGAVLPMDAGRAPPPLAD